MQIEFDSSKRLETFEKRSLDVADVAEVVESDHLTVEDDRFDYGEVQNITVGFRAGRMVVLAWTLRGGARRIISMREANDREQKAYAPRFR